MDKTDLLIYASNKHARKSPVTLFVEIEGYKAPEQILIPYVNILPKMRYINDRYDQDLVMKHSGKVRIIDYK